MGWFEDQLNQRKENDESAFGDSFLSLAGINTNDSEELKKIKEETYNQIKVEHNGSATIKDYISYMKEAIPVREIVFVAIFALISTGVGMLIPYFTSTLTSEVVASGDFNFFVSISVYLVAAAVGSLIIGGIQAVFKSRVDIKLNQNIQRKTINRILNFPASFFKKYNTGELSQRFGNTIGLASTIVNGVFMSLVSCVLSMAYLVQLVGFTPTLILPTVLILLLSTGFSILMSFIQAQVSKAQLIFQAKESGLTYEVINGVQKIRLSGSEKRIFVKWADVYATAKKLVYNPPLIIRLSGAISAVITLGGNIAIYFIAGSSDIDVGDYMAFQASYGILSAAFASLAGVVSSLANVKPNINMASPILETSPETEDDSKIKVDHIDGNIKIQNVSFSYDENLPNVLDDISLDINCGDYVAIVGKTGCGKSTLVRMLLGFEKPKSGKIYYDDMDMSDINLTSLRKNIGTVTQNGTLFHADILSNIIISAPNTSEEEAWKAAEVANIADDIRQMPMGMHTIISEGQGSISGGQKQRIMIARAIVHHPKILILDEATSALDNVTQQSISDSIDKLNCTRIVIAHRLSTIQHADRIIMLEGGKVIEDGKYDELIAKDGKFAELVARQRLDID